MTETIRFTLNGKPVTFEGDSGRTLLWVLRSDFGITGPKYGCGEGHCGSCTVLLDGDALPSCQITVKDAEGMDVTTIEGLEKNGSLHPLQEAFMEQGAFQCGFCTPGMILKAYSLLDKNPTPSKTDIIDGMENNLCRCGAHVRIIRAIEDASLAMKGGAK